VICLCVAFLQFCITVFLCFVLRVLYFVTL